MSQTLFNSILGSVVVGIQGSSSYYDNDILNLTSNNNNVNGQINYGE